MRPRVAVRSPFALVFTWAGALTFLVSLLYFLWSYARTFAIPVSGDTSVPAITWNVALFTVFALHHSAFARASVRTAIARVLPEPLERSLYVWIASLMFIAVCALWMPVPGVAWQVDGPFVWVLRGLQVAGLWLTLRSAAILDIWELAGVKRPEDAGTGIDASRPVVFRTTGPYAWVRHPIYSGWFLMVFAATPMTMTRLVFALVSCAYLLLAIPLEERSMRTSAAGAYDRYMRQVRWKLVPGVY